MPSIVCQYCKGEAELVSGQAVYPGRRNLYEKLFYKCDPCNAWVGCHSGTDVPLGQVANAALRVARSKAHGAFDPLWRDRSINRNEAYFWLAGELGLSPENCHIGMMNEDQCRQVVDICMHRGFDFA